jgi:hypothetical protein
MRTKHTKAELSAALFVSSVILVLSTLNARVGPSSSTRVVSVRHQADSSDVATPDYDEYEIEEENSQVDPYQGRSTWTPDQFGRLADSMGIDNRKGQSAAVAHVLASMKQGNLDAARKRLRTLLSTPGYMLDPDLAQVLVALDMVLGNRAQFEQNNDKNPASRDTVYLIDTVYKERPSRAEPDESQQPPAADSRMRDTIYVDVVKYDTVYVDREPDSSDQVQTGPIEPKEQPRSTTTAQRQQTKSDTVMMNRMAAMAEEIAKLKRDLERASAVTAPTTTTRQCFTILVASFADRAVAESEVKRLKRRYRRARLAVSESETLPFSVVVGYYQTVDAARADARIVSAAMGKRCRAVATTIAEKI